MLVSERQIFLNSIISIWNNSSGSNSSQNMENLEMRLTEYEQVVEQAVDNGINIVTQDMVVNWDYIQVITRKIIQNYSLLFFFRQYSLWLQFWPP